MLTEQEQEKRRPILDLYRGNMEVITAIMDGRLFGSVEANRRELANYEAKNSKLLEIIRTWDC
jgi:hypothetical protein